MMMRTVMKAVMMNKYIINMYVRNIRIRRTGIHVIRYMYMYDVQYCTTYNVRNVRIQYKMYETFEMYETYEMKCTKHIYLLYMYTVHVVLSSNIVNTHLFENLVNSLHL